MSKASPEEKLLTELEELKTQLSDATTAHGELLKSLQAQYEASEEALGKLKKDLAPRMKLLRAATAKPAAEADDAKKDEV